MPNSAAGFTGILVPGGVVLALPALSKTAALRALAGIAADKLGQSSKQIFERLGAREALGTTGFGSGAAIPHARLPGLASCAVIVARLLQPINWSADAGEPVDVLVLLLSPEVAGADHLKALARISRTLRDPDVLPGVRAAECEDTLLAALMAESVPAGN